MQIAAELRAVCAALPHSQEGFPFDTHTLAFKVGGKMYALCGLAAQNLSVSLKLRPEDAQALRDKYANVTPGDHLNKRHWVTVLFDAVAPEVFLALLSKSHALVLGSLSKAARAALGTLKP